jgi:hypothetical protein
VDGRKAKPVVKLVLLEICEGQDDEGRQQGGTGEDRAVIDGIPDL